AGGRVEHLVEIRQAQAPPADPHELLGGGLGARRGIRHPPILPGITRPRRVLLPTAAECVRRESRVAMSGRIGRERIAGAARAGITDAAENAAIVDAVIARQRADDGLREAVTEQIGEARERDALRVPAFVLPHRSAWAAAHGLSADDYQRRFDELARKGYRLVDVSGWWDGGQQRFAAIWETAGGPPWQARHGIPLGDYQGIFDALAADGFRPVRLSFYTTSTGPHVAGIRHGGPAPTWTARHGLSGSDFQREFRPRKAGGLRPGDSPGL